MSFMTEKKAQEVFKQQMQAELTNDDLARELERQLNDAGCYITSGPDGTTIKRKDGSLTDSAIDLFYAPKESTIAPSPKNDNPNRGVWIAVGISLLIAITVVVIIIIIKRRKNAPKLAGI